MSRAVGPDERCGFSCARRYIVADGDDQIFGVAGNTALRRLVVTSRNTRSPMLSRDALVDVKAPVCWPATVAPPDVLCVA